MGLLLLLLSYGSAQTQTATRINGRQHPELIPDNAAYRLVFIMQSHFSTEQEIQRSEQFHARLGLTTADHVAYDRALAEFRRQYDDLVYSHDSFVASDASANLEETRRQNSAYMQAIPMLVQATRSQLEQEMTKDGLYRLDAFVKSEKSNMVVGVRSSQ